MCLTAKTGKVHQAKKDIPCYKIMEYDGKNLLSVMMDFPYKVGETYTKDSFPEHSYTGEAFEGEGYHSYNRIDRVSNLAQLKGVSDRAAIECLIPKGSYYIVGEDDYLSSSITIVRILKKRRYNDIVKKIAEEKALKAAKRKKVINDKRKAKTAAPKLRRRTPAYK